MYAAGIFANGNNAPSGDILLLNTQTLKKNTLSFGEQLINPLNIYPNPANNYIKIVNQKANQNGTIILRNLSGQNILESVWRPIDQVGKLLNVSELPNGWYHLHLVLENGQKFQEKVNILH
ncbi:MAG: T9SS type A sorting domain-containing protein [Schleiferiaceae bacterium]|nr:T9SS type A sorting domain-containing protein [Schleiferiaceae bacterium]